MFNGHIPKIKRTYIINSVGTLKDTGVLTNDTTGVVNLANGEAGLLNQSANASDSGAKVALSTFIAGGSGTAYTPQIKIVQGTSTSANPPSDNRPGVKRPYESSAVIESDGEVQIVIKYARAAAYSIWGVSSINVADLTEYGTRIAFRSDYHDVFASDSYASVPVYPVSYTSPDYTTMISDGVLSSTAEALDHLIKNIVVQTNKNSTGLNPNTPLMVGNELVLALAIKAAGQASGVLTIAVGNAVTSVTIAGTVLAVTPGGTNILTGGVIAGLINGSAPLIAAGIVATDNADGTVTLIAPGVNGNAVTTTEIGADSSFATATLTGGVGTGVTELVAGTAVVIETFNGGTGSMSKSYTFSAEEIASLENAYSSTTIIGSLIVADISTATGTPSTPASDADVLAFVGLDRELFAAEDRADLGKTRLEVGLTSGYDTTLVSSVQVSAPAYGYGYPRDLHLGYEETQGRRDGDIQYRGQGMTKISYPSDVLALAVPQDQVIITHSQSKHSGLAKRNINLHETVILTTASVDSDGMSVNTPAALVVGAPTAGVNTLLLATAIETWARRNGVKVQVRYDV
jgi:hypothetical protein